MKQTVYRVNLTLTSEMLGTVPRDPNVYAAYIATKVEDMPQEQLEEELSTVPPSAEDVEAKGWTGFHVDSDGSPFIYSYMLRGHFKSACKAYRREKDDGGKKKDITTAIGKLPAYKQIADTTLVIEPRRIPLVLPRVVEVPVYATVENPDYDESKIDWEAYDEAVARLGKDTEEFDAWELEWWEKNRKFAEPTIQTLIRTDRRIGTLGVNERPLRAETAQGPRVTVARSDTVPAGTRLSFTVTSLGNVVTERMVQEWLDYGRVYGLGQWRSSMIYGLFEYVMERQEMV